MKKDKRKKDKTPFKPELLNAILKCFDALHITDQQWLVDRLADQWFKNSKKVKP